MDSRIRIFETRPHILCNWCAAVIILGEVGSRKKFITYGLRSKQYAITGMHLQFKLLVSKINLKFDLFCKFFWIFGLKVLWFWNFVLFRTFPIELMLFLEVEEGLLTLTSSDVEESPQLSSCQRSEFLKEFGGKGATLIPSELRISEPRQIRFFPPLCTNRKKMRDRLLYM